MCIRDSGMGASGKVNEFHGSTKYFREAFDSGDYIRVGELSPKSSKKELQKNYTLKAAIQEVKEKVKASK